MWGISLAWALCLSTVFAQWGTYYSFPDGRIYMRLKNNDMVALNFSITGFSDLDKFSTYSQSEINIESNQILTTLSLPPQNSSLFLQDTILYAFAGTGSSNADICGDGALQLFIYDPDHDEWVLESGLEYLDVNDESYYAEAQYLVSEDYSTVYIYGGICSSSGAITDRMLSFDLTSKTFSNITTSTQPQGFYGASSLWAPNPQNLLVVGGKASTGWLNMYQLATWNFESGWLFQTAAQNGTQISSRINPLSLPVFGPLTDNSSSTFENHYLVHSVLLIGGQMSDTSSDSSWARLSLASNQWLWSEINPDIDMDQVMGAATVFNTLVVVNSTTLSKRDSATYHVTLYDIKSFDLISDLKSNTVIATSSSDLSKTAKIAVGTVVPLAALSVIGAVAFYYWKRKMKDKSEVRSVDYPLEHFRASLNLSYDPLRPTHLTMYHPNDTNSTLDVGSIDSWVKKRQEYDAKRLRTLKRHSFLASNETLNGPLINDEDPEPEPEAQDLGETLQVPRPLPRIQQLKKSFLYSYTPPQLPHLKKGRLDLGFIDLGEVALSEENIDSDSCDENMDVQVLVSSKRKSVLRVMNPDRFQDESEVRLRTPSA